MEAKNWRYQVWVHYANEKTVTLFDSCKEERLALKLAAMMNAAVRHDTPPDMPQQRYYFVHPVTEEQIIEDMIERFRRRKNKNKKNASNVKQ